MLQPWRMLLGPSFARKVPRSLQLPRLRTQLCFHAKTGSLQATVNQQQISVQFLEMGHSHPNAGLLAARGDLGWKRGASLEHEGETDPPPRLQVSQAAVPSRALLPTPLDVPRCSSLLSLASHLLLD